MIREVVSAANGLSLTGLAAESQRYNQMDAAALFLNQQHMQNFGQGAGFNPNLSAVRNYLMANQNTQRPSPGNQQASPDGWK